jgi:prephenate dehydrogenase
MLSHTIGFVGGGRITAILLEALGGRGLALERVTVSDSGAEVLARLKARFPAIATTADNAEAASRERVFLALHPPALKAVLPELAPRLRRDAVVVPSRSLREAHWSPGARHQRRGAFLTQHTVSSAMPKKPGSAPMRLLISASRSRSSSPSTGRGPSSSRSPTATATTWLGQA